jgi:propionyl-CoA carboxylase alpha chain
MFQKILIANRGEIAVRIMRTARRMGIGTVAVYCDSDGDSLHVEMADEALNIGPPPASSSYLVIEKIVEACRISGAEAVHPGYGFLSERAAFAEALDRAGIAFIGPNAGAIAAMGDKIESKKLAAAAGVSTIPGHLGVIDDAEAALAIARDIGFPVMIKASAGGGGKGMRIARGAEEVREGFGLARSEARSSFGDDRVFIEKFIENPRHIEIQVLGDRHGHVIHLGERECSIQRRNQKIVEEAPSPAVDRKLRDRMGAEAVALARAVGYDSAGTVEFVMGEDRRFYFLEMNTRLQVEHPVTELVTGLDLVEQMIRIAAGEKLGIAQKDVRLTGAAIEARLYAEDPYRAFLPSIGRLTRYRPPAEGKSGATTVRVDGGVVEGSEISIYFDPLIAKLVTHGPDRAAATAAMADALDRTLVDGIAHNQPFLSALMDHPRWREGRLSTAFIAEEYPGGFAGVDPGDDGRVQLAMIALSVELGRRFRLRGASTRLDGGDRLPITVRSAPTEWVVELGKQRIALSVQESAESGAIFFRMTAAGGDPMSVVTDWKPGNPLWTGTVGGHRLTVQVRPRTGAIRLSRRGVDVVARVMTPRVAELDCLMIEKTAADASKALRSPMPGLVVAILVAPGETVRAGTPLAIVEAMKMENVLRAERDLTVARITVKQGDIVAVDAVLMEFE